MTAAKVLFTGDVAGDLPSLLKKLDAVNKKNGPFAAAFVTGTFLDADGRAQGLPLQAPSPLPIYFLGSGEGRMGLPAASACNTHNASGAQGGLPEGLDGNGLHYLGKAGVVSAETVKQNSLALTIF